MPMWIISGAMFPPPSGVMGTVVALNPMTYGIAGLRWALGVPAGDLPARGLCILVLGVSVVLSLVAAVAITRRR
jgi:ABC-type polysaccharide/polyol phosphate export permease